MNKADTKEAIPVVDRVLAGLLFLIVTPTGRPGSDARTKIGDTRAHLEELIRYDLLGPPMDDCFELVRAAGAPRRAFEALRKGTESIKTVTLGATLLKN